MTQEGLKSGPHDRWVKVNRSVIDEKRNLEEAMSNVRLFDSECS